MKIYVVNVVLSSCLLSCAAMNFQLGSQRRQTILERFDNSCGRRNLPITFHNLGVKSEGSKLVMNSTITVSQNISGDPIMTVQLEKCQNKENLDTCERLPEYKKNSFCTLIESDSNLWGPIFKVYQPKFKCPFTKNFHRAVNNTIDAAAFLLFPIDSWYWKVQIRLNEKITNKLIMCVLAEAHLITKDTP